MKKKIVLVCLLASLFLVPLTLSACEANKGGDSDSISSLISILTPEKTTLEVGESELLEVKLDASLEGKSVNWYSSDPSVVSVSQKGKIIALKEGTSEITCKAEGLISPSLLITVIPKAGPSITIDAPSKEAIEVNEELQLSYSVNGLDEEGINFVSDNENVSISSSGLVKGLAVGISHIHAQIGDVTSNEIALTILPESKELAVSLKETKRKSLIPGDSHQLVSQISGNRNNYPLEYASSDSSVLSVDDEGKVTALKEGSASITLKVHDIVSNPISLVVINEYSPAESVSYPTETIDIVKGEPLTFEEVTILPETADYRFSLKSSNPSSVLADGDTITGREVTSSPVKVTITAGTVSCEVLINVKAAFDIYLPKIKEKLEKAHIKEAVSAQSGHLYLVDQNAKEEDTTYDKYDFEVYSDSRSATKHQKKGTYSSSDKNERVSFTYCNDDLIEYTETYNSAGKVTDTTIFKKDVVEEAGDGYNEVNKAITENAVSYPYLGMFNVSAAEGQCGFAKYALYNYFGSSYFGTSKAENQKTFSYASAVEGVYTLKIDSIGYDSKNSLELTLSFQDDLLVSLKGKITKYSIDYDSDKETLTGYTKIDGSVVAGERKASADLYDPESFYLTDFDATFSTGYGSSEKTGVEFYTGESVSYDIINAIPSSYQEKVDTTYLSVKDEDKEKVVISNGKTLTAKEPIESLEVTIHAANVSKTFYLKFVDKLTTKLTYSGSTHMVAGDTITAKAVFDKNASVDILYSVTTSNADKATIVKKDSFIPLGYETFAFSASEAGTYSILAHDNKSGLDLTKDIVVYENDDEGVLNFLENVTPYYGSTLVRNIILSKKSEGTCGLSLSYEYMDEYDDYQTVTLTADLTYSAGAFTVSDASGDDVKISAVAFGEGHSKLDVSFSDGKIAHVELR